MTTHKVVRLQPVPCASLYLVRPKGMDDTIDKFMRRPDIISANRVDSFDLEENGQDFSIGTVGCGCCSDGFNTKLVFNRAKQPEYVTPQFKDHLALRYARAYLQQVNTMHIEAVNAYNSIVQRIKETKYA